MQLHYYSIYLCNISSFSCTVHSPEKITFIQKISFEDLYTYKHFRQYLNLFFSNWS